MRIPTGLHECTVFIGRIIQKGKDSGGLPVIEKPLIGTGFFVSVPSELHTGAEYPYLVTARHVSGVLPDGEWFVLSNLKKGIVSDEDQRAEMTMPPGEGRRWWQHPDDSVDAAVFQMQVPNILDSSIIKMGEFATNENIRKFHIGPGDEITYAGLFIPMTGKNKCMPLTRMGNVAMMPDEKVPGITILGKMYESEVFLAEVRSVGGLSGSPVFVREHVAMNVKTEDQSDPKRPPRDTQCSLPGAYLFLGLMHGQWEIKETEHNKIHSPYGANEEGSIALGISVVVPAQKIYEILHRPELVRQRREHDQAIIDARGSTSECST